MRVPADTDAMMSSIRRHWAQQQVIAESARARISSGTRIVTAADDAAGLSAVQRLRSVSQGQFQALRNAQEGVNLANVADGAMSSMTALLQQMRVLAMQSANGAYTAAQRGALQQAFEHTSTQLDAVVTGTVVNGVPLLQGWRAPLRVQVGAGAGHVTELPTVSVDRDDLGLSAAVSIAEQPDAESALDLLDDAIDELMAQRAQMAAAAQRLAGLTRSLAAGADLAQAAVERTEGVDIGAEAARMVRAQLVADVGVGLIAAVQQAHARIVATLLPGSPARPNASTAGDTATPVGGGHADDAQAAVAPDVRPARAGTPDPHRFGTGATSGGSMVSPPAMAAVGHPDSTHDDPPSESVTVSSNSAQ